MPRRTQRAHGSRAWYAPWRSAGLGWQWWRRGLPLALALVVATVAPAPHVRAADDGSWTPLPLAGAPSPRYVQLAVWTGQEMLIWGGVAQRHAYNDGALYNPKSQTWRPMAMAGAPVSHVFPVVTWTGQEVLIWGGTGCVPAPCTSGVRYDPATNTWRPMASVGAPQGGNDAAGVWTGRELLVWGGLGPVDTPRGPSYQARDDGAAYNPVTDTWRSLSRVGAPSPRWGHVAAWTGRELLIWGGSDWRFPGLTDGGAYNPVTDTWRALPTAGAPTARLAETAVWTGTEMLVWGGLQHILDTVN